MPSLGGATEWLNSEPLGSAQLRGHRPSAAGSEQFASPGGSAFNERHTYDLPEHLRLNHWALGGEWTMGREKVVLDKAGGSIAFRFHARDAHLVLSRRTHEPIAFRVAMDGQAPSLSHGVDVDADGNGLLAEGRLYQLLRQDGSVRERTLENTFLQPVPRRTCSRSGNESRWTGAGDEARTRDPYLGNMCGYFRVQFGEFAELYAYPVYTPAATPMKPEDYDAGTEQQPVEHGCGDRWIVVEHLTT